MTISKYIIELLKKNKELEIDMDHVQDGSDQYGLFKSPGREVKNYNDGSREITEHYQFLARQATISDTERKEADEWLEDLTYWVDDLAMDYDFPKLDGGRTVIGLSVTGCPYPMESKDDETLYQLALSITYIREREVD